jgi:protein-disulfide isomerase
MKTSAKWIAPIMAVALLSACGKGGDGNSTGSTSGNTAVTAVSGNTATAAAGTDWVSTVVKTPEFGFQMGNPNAAVKLIEYGALSCPHCATFTKESDEGLKALVAKGTVSYELRPFLIHPQDLPASLLAGCNGPAPFFTIAGQFFAEQQKWLAKSATLTQADVAAWSTQGETVYATKMGEHLELVPFVARMGIGADKAKACLANQKGIDELREIGKLASDKYKVDSTPTFIINGRKADDVNAWKDVEPLLRAAGA